MDAITIQLQNGKPCVVDEIGLICDGASDAMWEIELGDQVEFESELESAKASYRR